MFIQITEITDWKDLQVKVSELFKELGYNTFVNHKVILANGGHADVDVYAEMGNSPLAQKILFECKFWESDVPRAIVQSFKMDVQEAGANFGIVVSKKGFQSGSYHGINLTTVKLYTFEQLQEIFAAEWYRINIDPLKQKYSALAVKSKSFEFGTYDRKYFERTQINETLKVLADQLQHQTQFALAIFKDYLPPDIYWRQNVSHDMGLHSVAFHDARSFANALKLLFDNCIEGWRNYNDVFPKIRR